MNKADVSAGRRDITVWAESAGRRLYKNRIFYLKNILLFLFLATRRPADCIKILKKYKIKPFVHN
jgi:hypothetical protein